MACTWKILPYDIPGKHLINLISCNECCVFSVPKAQVGWSYPAGRHIIWLSTIVPLVYRAVSSQFVPESGVQRL